MTEKLFDTMDSGSLEEWKIQQKIDEIVSYDLIRDQTGLVNGYLDYRGNFSFKKPISILCKPYLQKFLRDEGQDYSIIDECFFWHPNILIVKSKSSMAKDLKNSSVIRNIAVKILGKRNS